MGYGRIQGNPVSSPVLSLVEGNNAALLRVVADLYLSPELTIADLTYGKGVFWKHCPELVVTGSDLVTVPERPYDFTATPYEDDAFDVAVLDPPYIHAPKNHITETQYQGKTVGAHSMRDILNLYRQGLREASRIARQRVLVKTKDTIEHGKQVWSHIHLHQQALELGLYPRDLFILKTQPPCENRWAGSPQKHSRKNLSYLWVFDKPKKRSR